MKCYLASRWRIQKTEETGLKQLEAAVTTLDQGGDRDGLLQQHDAAFCLPFKFNYHPHEGDQVKSLHCMVKTMLFHIHTYRLLQSPINLWGCGRKSTEMTHTELGGTCKLCSPQLSIRLKPSSF